MKHPIDVAHHVPGRMRLKVPHGRDNPEALAVVQRTLMQLPGVEDVSVNVATGSVVVRYAPDQYPDVNGHIRAHGGAGLAKPPQRPVETKPPNEFAEIAERMEQEAEYLAQHSHTARVIVDGFKDLDRQIKVATNNALDLKIVLAVGLTVATFAGIGAEAATPMWVTLGLFAVNHFIEMRPHTAPAEAA